MISLRRRLPGARTDTPEAFQLDGRRTETTTLVACVGDSITHGQVSANYVNLLKLRWEPSGYQFINAGVNGDLAYNVAARLDAVIACQPDVVTLLVGTNDVNAQFNEEWAQRYRKGQSLPVAPTKEWYRENIDSILTRLQTETKARTVALQIPILGEDLSSRMNDLVAQYNVELETAGRAHDVPCLPLNDRLRSQLATDQSPPAYEGDVTAIMKAGLQHLMLRRSWDTVSRRNGLALLTDHIHLNDRAAATVAELIGTILVNGDSPAAQPTADR